MGRLTGRPHLLFLCQTLPYPPDGGVWIRTYHVLRLLARAFDITALCFERSGTRSHGSGSRHRGESRGAEPVRERRGVRDSAAAQPAQVRLGSPAEHRLGSRLHDVPVRVARFRRRLDAAAAIDTRSILSMSTVWIWRGYLAGVPRRCRSSACTTTSNRRCCGGARRVEPSRWRRAYLRYQARLMNRVERRWCGRVALNVAVSEQDRGAAEARSRPARASPSCRTASISRSFGPAARRATGVAYVGGTSPFPNLDALDFFCEQILPHLRAAAADVPARWIGRASTDEQRALPRTVRHRADRLRRGRQAVHARRRVPHRAAPGRRRHATEDPQLVGDGEGRSSARRSAAKASPPSTATTS